MQGCSSCNASGGGTCDNNFNNLLKCEAWGSSAECYCFTTIEGDPVCGANTSCLYAPTCSSSDQCGPGFVCMTANGCTNCSYDYGICAPTCIVSP
jgi:hypothetical protein